MNTENAYESLWIALRQIAEAKAKLAEYSPDTAKGNALMDDASELARRGADLMHDRSKGVLNQQEWDDHWRDTLNLMERLETKPEK